MQTFVVEPLIAAAIQEIGFWCGIGILAGALARWILPGDQKMNWILTMILGIAGAFLGGFLTSYLPIENPPGWMPLVSATVGAFLLLVIVQALGLFKPKS